ncbi:MAG TPA: DsbE family thiol:disulfide interchange protein [Alphaproteobacteria bacterium]|nr:DsbE family thiol:disulfide interchange protein [Alphaproteobacteria bacterium]
MKRHILALLPLVFFIVLIGLFATPLLRGTDPSKIESAMIGKPAPDFVLPGVLENERPFVRADLAGQNYALVNFFASWCVPCQAEQPVLSRIAAEDGVAIFGVNYKDNRDDAIKWLEKHGNPFAATGYDNKGRVSIDWGVYGVPETYVVNRAGVILYRHVGPLTWQDYNSTIKPLMKKG